MKKIIAIFLSLSFLSIQSLKAETMGVGITGAFHMLDVSGTETTRSSGEKNNGSHEEDVLVPEIFVEAILDNGAAIGLSYIPTRDMGSKSRSDTNSEGDTGSYKAEAELDNVVQIYADIPFGDVAGYNVYGKVGIQHATIVTLESLNSGSTYPDADVYGYTVGLGTKGDLPYGNNMYYKAEVTYTDFEDYSADSNSSPANKVEAELEDIAAKLSIGYKF
tara:strand:+ start:70 stop:726 length:657 start_codon:yes stop_codon:yes gene_type:complete